MSALIFLGSLIAIGLQFCLAAFFLLMLVAYPSPTQRDRRLAGTVVTLAVLSAVLLARGAW